MFSSLVDAREKLLSAGYIADEVTITTVFLAAAVKKPILLEGPPGSGKTELAYAVAHGARTEVERLQCFEGINEEKAIGKFDESLQRLYVELRAKSGQVEWETVKEELHGRKFFSPGPLVRALLHPSPCVLLIDELDKVDQAFEAMLLELLSVWQISIPKLGLVKAESVPFVVLTSNEERRISEAIPPEWYGYDHNALTQLVESLYQRRRTIRDLISGFKNCSRNPFPNWTERSLPG